MKKDSGYVSIRGIGNEKIIPVAGQRCGGLTLPG